MAKSTKDVVKELLKMAAERSQQPQGQDAGIDEAIRSRVAEIAGGDNEFRITQLSSALQICLLVPKLKLSEEQNKSIYQQIETILELALNGDESAGKKFAELRLFIEESAAAAIKSNKVIPILNQMKQEVAKLGIGSEDREAIYQKINKMHNQAAAENYGSVIKELAELEKFVEKREEELANPTAKSAFKKLGELVKAAIEVCIETISMGKIAKGAKENYQSLQDQRKFEKTKDAAQIMANFRKQVIIIARVGVSEVIKPPPTPRRLSNAGKGSKLARGQKTI